MILFQKEYLEEELCDLERDVTEALQGDYNALMHTIPFDRFGSMKGVFKVTIEWEDDE